MQINIASTHNKPMTAPCSRHLPRGRWNWLPAFLGDTGRSAVRLKRWTRRGTARAKALAFGGVPWLFCWIGQALKKVSRKRLVFFVLDLEESFTWKNIWLNSILFSVLLRICIHPNAKSSMFKSNSSRSATSIISDTEIARKCGKRRWSKRKWLAITRMGISQNVIPTDRGDLQAVGKQFYFET